MATCPSCGVSSRADPNAIHISPVLEVHGGVLGGSTPKVAATYTLRMFCQCGWSIAGWLEDEDFVGAGATQVWPTYPEDDLMPEDLT